MTIIGNHMKFSVHKSLRERVRSFYLNVLECTTMTCSDPAIFAPSKLSFYYAVKLGNGQFRVGKLIQRPMPESARRMADKKNAC